MGNANGRATMTAEAPVQEQSHELIEPMGTPPNVRTRGLQYLRVVVTLALLGFLAWRMDWTRISGAFFHLQFEWWVLGVAVFVLAQTVSAYRWQLLAEPLGYRGPLRRYIAYYFIGMFFNMMLPTSVGGDVVRAWYLAKDDRYPAKHENKRLNAFLSVLVDRASGLLLLLWVACAGLLCCPIALPQWIHAVVWGAAALAVAGILLIPWVRSLLARQQRLRRLVDGAFIFLKYPRVILVTTGLSLFVQAANVVVVWLIGVGLGAGVPGSYYWILVPMVTLLTLLPFGVNGMGIREYSMVLFLEPLGVRTETAVCLSILWFAVMTAASTAGGIVYLLGHFSRPEVSTDDETLGSNSDQG